VNVNANKLFGLVVSAIVVGMIVASWPEIVRYRRMTAM
jgi:hypothetical protein